MHTLIILLASLGFFMLYNTSKRARLSTTGKWEQWLQVNPKAARRAGTTAMMFSVVLWIYLKGLGVGICSAVVMLMTLGSFMIMIAPFFYIKWQHVLALSVACLILELLIF